MGELTGAGGLEGQQQFSPEAISQDVDRLMTEVLGFYAESERFRVEDDRKDGSGIVRIWVNDGCGDRPTDSQPYQEIEYGGDTVISISSDWERRWYRYDQERQEVQMWTSESSMGNSQRHSVDCKISPASQLLREITYIQTGTCLTVEYYPITQEGELGFQSNRVLSKGLCLPFEDVEKFLPGGRFIPFSDLLQFVVNPAKQYSIDTQRVCAIDKTDSFLRLNYLDVNGHAMISVSTPDHDDDKVSGFAHPLKDNPDSWLVFARFGDGELAQGRALIVTVDRESVQVQDVEGTPTINVQVSIDGEQSQLAIPEVLGRWEDVTDENISEALDTWADGSGVVARVLLRVTCEELAVDVEQGYCVGDMLNAALGEHYEKYYGEGGFDL